MTREPKLLPAYQVEKLEGEREHTIKVPIIDEDGKHQGFEDKTVKIDAGYMVYFRRGHSVRLSEEELIAHGFNKDAPLMDDEGEVHGQVQTDLKARSEAVSGPSV